MSNHEKKSPASVAALSRISEIGKLRNACTVMLTHNIVESKGEEPVTLESTLRLLDEAVEIDAHRGREDASSLIAGFVDSGLLTESDSILLHEAARLLADECSLEIDPLLEVARRVLALRLASGGRSS